MGPDLADVEPLLAPGRRGADTTVLVGYHYSQTMRLTQVAAAYGPTVVIPTAHPEGAFHVGWVDNMFEHADHVDLPGSGGGGAGGARSTRYGDRHRRGALPGAGRPRPAQSVIDAVRSSGRDHRAGTPSWSVGSTRRRGATTRSASRSSSDDASIRASSWW